MWRGASVLRHGLRFGARTYTRERQCTRRIHFGPQKGDRVTVAMSGGVDSSVAALRLAMLDYDVDAVYMRNWSTLDESGSMQAGSGGGAGCDWQAEWNDVQRVCCHLGGIPVKLVDLSREYWLHVFEPALSTWASGATPNPDVHCNRCVRGAEEH